MEELANKKILIADDETEILKMIEDSLYREGFFNLHTASSCKKALETAESQPIALFLLDINMPDGNGFMLYNNIRRISDAPVIFLTARGEDEDRVRGLSLGADDYIVKPFLMKELILRIKAILRRTYGTEKKEKGFCVSGRYVDFENAEVTWDNKSVPVTAKELLIIKKLYENKNRIVTNDTLAMTVWGEEYYGHENTLMVHIRHLREKIEYNPSAPRHIKTVKGIGYKLVTDNE